MSFRRGAVVTALLGAGGCAVSPESPVNIMSVSPAAAYADAPLTLTVSGAFRAAYTIDTVGGHGAVDIHAYTLTLHPSPKADGSVWPPPDVPALAVTWLGEGVLSASLPAGIAAGSYDVEVGNPHGGSVSLPRAFTSLGDDRFPPVLSLISPPLNTLLGAGTDTSVSFQANDTPGWLAGMSWRAYTDAGDIDAQPCLVPAAVHASPCLFTIRLPPDRGTPSTLSLALSALDQAQPMPREATLLVNLPVAPAPMPMGPCSAVVGPTEGGTLVTVPGTNFVRALADDPASGTELVVHDNDGEEVLPQVEPSDANQISGITRKHREGRVTIEVHNGSLTAPACTFTFFIPGPVIRTIAPSSGSGGGGTRIVITGSSFPNDVKVRLMGDVRVHELCLTARSATYLEGVMPPGTGTVQFVADGGAAGTSDPAGGFAYDVDVPDDPLAWPVAGCPQTDGP